MDEKKYIREISLFSRFSISSDCLLQEGKFTEQASEQASKQACSVARSVAR